MNYDFDMNILLQAMRDGSTQEEIANKFAAALNKASATIKQEKAIQKQKEAQDAKKKLAAAQAVADFYNTYYCDMMPDEVKLTAEEIIEVCDSAMASVKKFFPVKGPKNSVENPLFKIFNL